MTLLLKILIGLIAGYIVGIILGAFGAFVLDFESAARFVATGSALIGAVLGPRVLRRLDMHTG
jgi:hypothetical protein